MPTFAELGVPFPLIAGTVEYAGVHACHLCATRAHRVDIGVITD